ncbi:MAG: response regulator [Gulosibacter sp.]|uniref:response regulator n=1 Tax=Gulosibacter sp. TaxID=2817531 RepID=UPI003F911E81
MADTDVVIIDPHQLIRAGFSLILQAQPEFNVVAEGDSTEAAVELVRRFEPHVLCLAARMDGTDSTSGLEATRRIRALADVRQPRILILVGSKDGHVSEQALDAGADAVVAKYSTPESIVMALRSVAAAD